MQCYDECVIIRITYRQCDTLIIKMNRLAFDLLSLFGIFMLGNVLHVTPGVNTVLENKVKLVEGILHVKQAEHTGKPVAFFSLYILV